LAALHRKGCAAPATDVASRGAFFAHLVRSLCWDERAERLLAPGDQEYLLQVEDRAELTDDLVRRSAALLVQEGILSPDAENRLRPRQPITRGEANGLLAGAAERAGSTAWLTGDFRGLEAAQLSVELPEGLRAYPLDREVRLFRAIDGDHFTASELSLVVGDRVSFVVRGGRVVYLEAEQSRLGAAADRASRYYRWEVRLTPVEVARSIARYGQVGAVRDVVPLRLGVSGRVVELVVLGSDGELLLSGLKIRWALGLRENLFVIDRETGPDGAVARFVFTGKGWGHGVGLCQVGASGLAQTGAKAEAILKHYYTGVSIVRAY
jgi:stage II sporulation protein D